MELLRLLTTPRESSKRLVCQPSPWLGGGTDRLCSGYKEFSELPLGDRQDPSHHPGFPNMLRQTKTRTYQYAKSQLKWIRKQVLPVVAEAKSLGGDVHIYVVPGGGAAETAAVPLLHGQ